MAEQERHEAQPIDPFGPDVPVMQRVLDSPFLLLFLGIAIPTIFYLIWAIMEIVTIPIAK